METRKRRREEEQTATPFQAQHTPHATEQDALD
jgi:hypothetical protein